MDRGKPGVIGVLSTGRRFVNEADGYYQYTTAMIENAPAGEAVASWLVCDHAFQRRYPFGMAKPFPVPVADRTLAIKLVVAPRLPHCVEKIDQRSPKRGACFQ